MSDTRFTGANEAAIVERVAKEMGVAMGFGAAEEARREAPPRITWVWKGERYTRDPAQQRADMLKAHEVDPLFDVHVWGRDYLDAADLRTRLLGALFNALSPNAYELAGEGKPGTDDEGKPVAVGIEIVIPVRLLKVPVPSRLHQRVTLDTKTSRGVVTGPVGETPTSDGGTVVVPVT